MSSQFAIILTLSILLLNFFVFSAILLRRLVRGGEVHLRKRIEKQLLVQIREETLDLSGISARALLSWYNRLAATVKLEEVHDQAIREYLLASRKIQRLLKQLRSPFMIRRVEAVAKLRNLSEDPLVHRACLDALREEKSQVVTLYLFEALARGGEKKAIIPMLKKLRKATPWMAARYRALLITYEGALLPYLLSRLSIDRIYLKLLITEYAAQFPSDRLRDYLVTQAQGKNTLIRHKALHALSIHYPKALLTPVFFESPLHTTPIYVIRAYAQLMDPHYVSSMLTYADRKGLREQLVQSLSEMAARQPSLVPSLMARFERKQRSHVKAVLAKVLNNRLTYLLESHEGPLDERLINLIGSLVKAQYISGLVQFLNTNTDEEKQTEVLHLLSGWAKRSPALRKTLFNYLHPGVYKMLKLAKPSKTGPAQEPHKEKPQRALLILFIIISLSIFPLIIFLKELPNLVTFAPQELVRLYVVRFNYLLAFYFTTISVMSLIILTISFHAGRGQHRLWMAKDTPFLFTRGVLPSVSVIGPAFNEEANIIESTNSLLNQHYPDFELIIVNDGSRDNTLQSLISYFDLEKQDRLVQTKLKTRPLRGIYTNKNIPNLIVVDKMNGGKADSLNLGLNVASKEFFCGIDADSLLEPDALLKAVSVMLDHRTETIATGGNIFPVNGCSVELGSIDTVRLPDKFLARLQSLEYIRSFMTGRLGWAKMNLLLIISGAFGIFHRERTIATGGYLTRSGKYRKDTVGEDMELVVRLTRYMREKRKPYRVQYAGNANCWTEVPEKWKVFRRQRDRWHRGLIDIMIFHSSMIANPAYGRLGMVGMPYYFLFELVGPLIEAQGFIMVIVSAVLGMMNLPLALTLFTTTVLLGILVSLTALFISDYDHPHYSIRDITRLLGMTVIENFGVRQMISLLRVTSYFSSMRKNRGWGAQVRTGFKKSKG